MAKHLGDEILTDALEGAVSENVREHLRGCASCAARLESARAGLELARHAHVPDPPAMYWEAFPRQVGRRIERAESERRLVRFVVPALAAAAALVAAFAVLLPRSPLPASPAAELLPAWSALPPAEEDAGLTLLEALAPTVADAGSLPGCRGLAACLVGLSEEESRALADAVQAALDGREL
jgi:hypothetical protein